MMEMSWREYIDKLEWYVKEHEDLTKKAIELSEKRKKQAKEFKRHADALAEALEPFAHFIEQWNKKPLGFDVDDIYSIHSGTEWEASITISNLQRALAALTNYRSRDE